jgi:hypothetical protein
MTKTYPDDCIQALVGAENWWQPNREHQVCRGALITAFVPYIDQMPYAFEPIGRTQATEHQRADVKVTPMRVEQALKQAELPVAAMPLHAREVWAAYRAKRRPCLVLSVDAPAVDKDLTRGMPSRSSAPTMIVAPYYGADKGNRAGYNPAFVERIRHCEYPQFLWDVVPLEGASESILRLDQMQPIGRHYQSFKVHDVRLSEPAMEVVDGMIDWLLRGGIPKDHPVLMFQELVRTL